MKKLKVIKSLDTLTGAQLDPVKVYLSSLAPSGRRSVKSQLNTVAKMLGYKKGAAGFPWHQLRYQHVAQVRFLLFEKKRSINTINFTLAAIRGVVNAAFNLELVDADTVMRIKAVKSATGNTTRPGCSLTKKEVKKLLKRCERDRSVVGVRDTALIALMVTTGLRRNEVVNLQLSDYETRTGKLVSRSGKGRKRREVKLPKVARQHVKKWLNRRGEGSGALFCPVLKTERVVVEPMATYSIYKVVKGRTTEARVTVCTPHDLRRTYVTLLLDANVDINTVRQMVGHASIATTCRYDRRDKCMENIGEMIF